MEEKLCHGNCTAEMTWGIRCSRQLKFYYGFNKFFLSFIWTTYNSLFVCTSFCLSLFAPLSNTHISSCLIWLWCQLYLNASLGIDGARFRSLYRGWVPVGCTRIIPSILNVSFLGSVYAWTLRVLALALCLLTSSFQP